jgi:hypothetical protein
MLAKEVILSYAPSNCEQLACVNKKNEEKIFNNLVKRYNKCHIYNEKQKKKKPWYVVDSKPMSEEEYENSLPPEELAKYRMQEASRAEYKSGQYFSREEKKQLVEKGIAKSEFYFKDITKETADIITKAQPKDEDTIRKNIVGYYPPFYNLIDFLEATKCIEVLFADSEDSATLYDVILNLGNNYLLKNEDYFVSIKTPEEVKWVADKLSTLDHKCSFKLFKESDKYMNNISEYYTQQEYKFFINNFENHKEFWNNAAKDKKYMLFVMSLY